VRGAHYVLIWFANPQNAPVAGTEADSEPHHRWTFGGSSIDDLTLSPSVNLDIPSLIEVDHCRSRSRSPGRWNCSARSTWSTSTDPSGRRARRLSDKSAHQLSHKLTKDPRVHRPHRGAHARARAADARERLQGARGARVVALSSHRALPDRRARLRPGARRRARRRNGRGLAIRRKARVLETIDARQRRDAEARRRSSSTRPRSRCTTRTRRSPTR
jgi:hypothetical protein